MNRIRIDVTDEDIRLGRKSDCRHCPVANALKRKFSHTSIKVTDSRVTIRDSYSPLIFTVYDTSLRLGKFIRSFDKGQKVSAGTYYITKFEVLMYTDKKDWSAK